MRFITSLVLLCVYCLCLPACRSTVPFETDTTTVELKFLAIGCGPYIPQEEIELEQYIEQENARAGGEFLIHLGDIVTDGQAVERSHYVKIARLLKKANMPTFIVPGDNEWNDSEDPDRGWRNWSEQFMGYHRYWDRFGSFKRMYPVSGGVDHQAAQPENFAFVRKGVLLIGINLPGGRVHDPEEWATRLPLNADWVADNYRYYGNQVRAAVIFAQAAPGHNHEAFFTPFRAASKTFGKPVLYLHADGHRFSIARPWSEQNILQVQTDQLGIAPPLLVTVKEEGPDIFQFDRQNMRGPYLALGTPTSMRVVWRTLGQTEPMVRYGRSPTALNQHTATGDILTKTKDHPINSRALHSSPDGMHQHEATISALEPATTYYYAVYDGDRRLAGGDRSYQFTTPPRTGTKSSLRLWVVGDSGTGAQKQADVHNAMMALTRRQQDPIDLFLHVGDMAYTSGTDFEFQTKFFNPYAQTLRNTVCWPAMGNHEGTTSDGRTGIGPYYDCFVLPAHGEAGGLASGTEAYYSYDYGHVHFIVLDSYDLDRSPTADMAQWLRSDLEQTHADWIFAYWHHPPYTKGSHDSDTETQLIEMRENIMPILEDGGVDMVFTGHSHIYERSMLIDGAYHTPTTATGVVLDDGDGDPAGDGPYRKRRGLHPHEGTVAIVTGHGGTGLNRIGTMPIMRRTIHTEHGSLIVDVRGDTATCIMLNSKGEQRDCFRIVKRSKVTTNRIAHPHQPPAYEP